jgi:Uma2 family endonuclease
MVRIRTGMVKTKRLCTYEDYAALPDDQRHELIWGELMMSPSPNARHQAASVALEEQILIWIRRTRAGRMFHAPFDVVLDAHTTVQPDVIFVSNERKRIITDRNIQGAPDLVVEIISPGTEDRDRLVKTRLYREHGVREFWLVDPDARQVTLYTPSDARVFEETDTLVSEALPGLAIPLQPLFQSAAF